MPHSNHRSISHRFRSAPTCHGQTPNTITLQWNCPLVHKQTIATVHRSKQRATIGLCWSVFLYFPFNANISNAAAVAGDSDDSDVVAGDASYVLSPSLLLLSAVRHNASMWARILWSGSLPPVHATISSVVVSRYTRFDSFVVKHFALFLWTTNISFSTPAFSAPPATSEWLPLCYRCSIACSVSSVLSARITSSQLTWFLVSSRSLSWSSGQSVSECCLVWPAPFLFDSPITCESWSPWSSLSCPTWRFSLPICSICPASFRTYSHNVVGPLTNVTHLKM